VALSLASDFKVYNEQFQGGFIETLQQATDINGMAAQSIRIVNRLVKGHYEQEAFTDQVVTVSERDITSDAAITPIKLTQDEFIGVKKNWRIGPYQAALDAYYKTGRSPDAMPFEIGVQAAKATIVDQLNTALGATRAALETYGTTVTFSATGGTITTEGLIDTMAKAGDASARISLWVMHSKQYHDLLKDQVTDAVYRADGVTIMQGVPATLGRPVLITDSPDLVQANGVSSGIDEYHVLGLYPGALELAISEPPRVFIEQMTGSANLKLQWQAEGAYNLKLRGFQWDTTNGGIDPTNAELKTGTNWDAVVADRKLLSGVLMLVR